DAMSADEQDAFYERNTQREENQLWDGAMRRFEDTHPERFGELEEITDTIQSARTEDLIEEDSVEAVDVAALIVAADVEYKKLEEMTIDGVTKDGLEARFAEIAMQAQKVHDSYQTIFQNTDDPAVGVTSLVKAADLYVLVAKKLRAVESVEGMEASALAERAEAVAKPLEDAAVATYQTAIDKAEEAGVDNEAVTRAKNALSDGGTTDNEGEDSATPEDGAGDEEGGTGEEEGGEEEGGAGEEEGTEEEGGTE